MSQQKLIDIAGGQFVPTTILTDAAGNPVVPASAIPAPSVGTLTSVASAIADTAILAANSARKSAIIDNESTAVLHLLFSTGVSSLTSYSIRVPAGGNYTVPLGGYTGVIKGIWAAANGFARVTELV